jgi:heme A synthase
LLFGISITPRLLMTGGAFLFLVLAFQVLVGLKIIRLGKPRTQMRVHRILGYVLLGIAAAHGLLGIIYGLGMSIP